MAAAVVGDVTGGETLAVVEDVDICTETGGSGVEVDTVADEDIS